MSDHQPLDPSQVLDQLASAQTAAELAKQHAMLNAAVRGKRSRDRHQWGVLAQTYMAAMEHWDAQKRDGVSAPARIVGLAASLKAAWPKGRTEDWKYVCANCLDCGLEMKTCPGDATCGRLKPHLPHDFGTPCWCPIGQRFRVTPKQAKDYTDAAQTRPARVGRR